MVTLFFFFPFPELAKKLLSFIFLLPSSFLCSRLSLIHLLHSTKLQYFFLYLVCFLSFNIFFLYLPLSSRRTFLSLCFFLSFLSVTLSFYWFSLFALLIFLSFGFLLLFSLLFFFIITRIFFPLWVINAVLFMPIFSHSDRVAMFSCHIYLFSLIVFFVRVPCHPLMLF